MSMISHDLHRARQLVINELISEHETLTNTVCSDTERELIKEYEIVALYTGKCWTMKICLRKHIEHLNCETLTHDLGHITNQSVPILAFLRWYFKEHVDEYVDIFSIKDLQWFSQVIACFPNASPSVCLLKSQLTDEIREHLIMKREATQACSSVIGIVILLGICSVVIWICT